ASAEKLNDGSVRFSGKNPDKDTYILVLNSTSLNMAAIRLETLTDSTLPKSGPGRTAHGNFVLSEISARAGPRDIPDSTQPVKFLRAASDSSQDGYPVAHAIDGNPRTGWAIQGRGKWNMNRTATFTLAKPVGFAGGTRWAIRLDQQFGSQHTIGRLRLSL